ncbi:MAG: hypothetical protein Q7T40_02975 [Methylobacter sp.]|nr:hypothetical protein [Methylobacter sp.]
MPDSLTSNHCLQGQILAPALLYYTPFMVLCNICIHHIPAVANGNSMSASTAAVGQYKVIFDGRNRYEPDRVKRSGLAYYATGR